MRSGIGGKLYLVLPIAVPGDGRENALIEAIDMIALGDRFPPVGDMDTRHSKGAQVVVDRLLAKGIEMARGLIQDQEPRTPQEGARE